MVSLLESIEATKKQVAEPPKVPPAVVAPQRTAPTGSPLFNMLEETKKASQLPTGVAKATQDVTGIGRSEALLFAAGMGLKDTYRGVKQLSGLDLEDMEADEQKLKAIFANPEFGKEAQAAWIGGMVLDPAGWLVPLGKARTVGKLALYGAGFSGLSGFLGYVDEDDEQWKQRLINAGIGAGAGAIITPAVGKGVEAIGKLIPKKPPLAGVAPGAATDEVSELVTPPLDLNTVIPQVQGRRTLMQPAKEFYQATVGAPLKKFVWNNGGSLAFASIGAVSINEVLKDTELSETSRVGATLAGFAALATTGKLTSKTELGQWMARQVIDNYGLSPDYVTLKRSMMTDQNNIAARFMDVAEDMKNLEPNQRNALYRILNGEEAWGPEELMGIASDSRMLLKDIGQKMVDYGLLDERVFQNNLNTYLNRSYKKYLEGSTELSRLSEVFVRKIRMIGTELRPRGIIKDVSAKNEQKWIDEGYEVLGKGRLKGTIKVRRQLTPDERKAMGEIDDAAFAMVRTGRLMSNDVSRYKFYDDVNKNFAVDLPEGDDPNAYLRAFGPDAAETLLGANPALQTAIKSGEKLMKVDGGKIKGTEVYQYGNLEGKWVPESIYRDLKWMERYSKTINTPFIKGYRELQQYWKIGKTAWNPAVHMNNIISNTAMYDLAEGNYKNLGWAFNEMLKGPEKSAFVREAVRNGVFDADLFTQELNASNRNFLKDYLVAKGEDHESFLLNSIKAVKNLSGQNKGWLPAQLYAFEDKVFRMALYKTRVERGFDPQTAVKEARKWFIDYDINAPMINLMRETVTPFISYSYRVIPLLAESAIMRPWKYAKWAALGYGLSYMGEDVVETDTAKERRLMAKWEKGDVFGIPGMPPKMLKMPVTVDGIPQYLNVSRWIPGGDVFEAKGNDNPLPSFLAPGGVALVLASGLLGYDTFRGDKIEGMLDGELINNLKVKAEYIFNQMIPNLPAPFVLTTPASKKLEESIRGAEYIWKEPLPVWQAALQLAGVKLTPTDLSKMEARAAAEYLGRMSQIREDVMLKAAKAYAENRISLEQYQQEILRVSKLIDKTSREFQEKQTGVKPPAQKFAEGGTVEAPFNEEPPPGMRFNPVDGPKWVPIEEPNEFAKRVREFLKTPKDVENRADLLPIKKNEKGEIEFAMPNMVREGLQSLWNIMEGTKTGRLNPQDALVLGGTSGVASRIGPKGTLGMFAGSLAEGAPLNKKFKAKGMLEEGKSPELVRQDTGWFKGKDGKWRFEIDDSPVEIRLEETLKKNKLDYLDDETFFKLEDIIDHPTLFKAYPELKDYTVTGISLDRAAFGYKGLVNPKTKKMALSPTLTGEKLKETILHEIQHIIQTKEGFSGGANRRMFLPRDLEKISDEEYNVMNEIAAEKYLGAAGEVEARVTSARRNLTEGQRKSRNPEADIDIDPDMVHTDYNKGGFIKKPRNNKEKKNGRLSK